VTFPIVGIAASAGGLEAASELLAALPSRCGMAFVLVQHLDPVHESLLSEILGARTSLKVLQATDGLPVEADHVYVIPPNATLTLNSQHLKIAPRATGRQRFKPADTLFRSLADACADRAIAVVLSGGDADGSLGLQAIKHGGGITFAQEPATARFPSMPQSAIETGAVDFVLAPARIAKELLRLVRHPYLRSDVQPQDHPNRVDGGGITIADEEETLRRVFRRLRAAHGVDFSHYKRSTLRRRLNRRMALHRIEDADDYASLIDRDPTEVALLYQDFLIRVTGFFRDPESFAGLTRHVFPGLIEGRSAQEPIRIWVPGCASGEEVYSIAMSLVESLGDRPMPAGLQIFGTDVSEAEIEKARAGVYPDSIAQDVPAERIERFFVKQDDHYRIAKSIRDACIFARHDVMRDPPFSRLDLVSCRNLLIYLDAVAQRRVMQVFQYALRPHGYLMVGPSESVGQATDLFDLVDKHHRLYARRATLPTLDLPRTTGSFRPREGAADVESDIDEAESAQHEADRVLLARFAPASVLVDDALNILHFRGETGPYLEHASGPPSLNLSRMVRPELLVEISPALREARETAREVRRSGLRVGGMTDIAIEVIPLKHASQQPCYLILFEDGSRPSPRGGAPTGTSLPESEKDRLLAQAQREVASIRDYLQATIEEQEAVKEELKSAHEEVLSANEEFQSTNEELETAKEELQSANEELITTNDELRNRNRELGLLNAEIARAREHAERARAYADAIVEAVREPLLVLDPTLAVLRANRAFYAKFLMRPEDTDGKLFYELENSQWDIPSLRQQLEAVLTGDAPMTEVDVVHRFPDIGERVMCLSARRIASDSGRRELILLAIEDVTEQRARTDTLREGGRRKDEFLAMLAHELRNPLTPIIHAIGLLRREDGGGSTQQHLHEMIERQTKRLSRLVDELLDVARISRGIIDIKRQPVNLTTITRDAAESIAPRIEEFGHTLSLSLPDVPVHVDGDAVRLEQVVTNVLENAAKYTDRGGRITVTLAETNDEAVLSVRDTGIGLAPESIDSIFETFAQADTSLARERGGLGLGLSVVRRVLDLHGGRIEAHSEGLGQGSEFIVRLPLLPRPSFASGAESGARPSDRVAARAREC
jgi:two-component system CheB/CheR fusion protein